MFRGVTRVHARSSATQFLLQFDLIRAPLVCRETSRVSFLMCPFCVRATASVLATHLCDVTRPATSAVTGYEGPGWTGQLEQQLMPLLQDYGSVVVEDHDSLWQQWPTEAR